MAGQIKLRPALTTAEKMIKVDHAGENGAVNIYRAQTLISNIRARSLLADLKEFQTHEENHRDIFRTYLEDRGIRPCVSYHLCGLGGYGLGLITGLIGPTAVMATTYAVENVVLGHLEHQSVFLEKDNPAAFDCVSQIIKDEQEHHDHASENFDSESLLARGLVRIVKLCTEGIIRFGMR